MTRELDEAWFRRNGERVFRTRWPTAQEAASSGAAPTANGPLMTIVRRADFGGVTCSLPAPARNDDRYLGFLFDLGEGRRGVKTSSAQDEVSSFG